MKAPKPFRPKTVRWLRSMKGQFRLDRGDIRHKLKKTCADNPACPIASVIPLPGRDNWHALCGYYDERLGLTPEERRAIVGGADFPHSPYRPFLLDVLGVKS